MNRNMAMGNRCEPRGTQLITARFLTPFKQRGIRFALDLEWLPPSDRAHEIFIMRETIFSKIQSATEALKTKAALPDYDSSLVHSLPKLEGSDLWEIFSRNFSAVNGKPMTSIGQLIEFLKQT